MSQTVSHGRPIGEAQQGNSTTKTLIPDQGVMVVVDHQLEAVEQQIQLLDPDGSRTAGVLRLTLDQLYDGHRTGRYRIDQLHKTEKTYCGTIVEINMQREFLFDDGDKLDFSIAGHEVDCKYSQSDGGWMIPLEAVGELCLVVWADDEKSKWSMGLIRAEEDRLRGGGNRDRKTSLKASSRKDIHWFHRDAELPENLLLQLPRETADLILDPTSTGAERVRRLLTNVQGRIIDRTAVETAAQQKDPMKRLRKNGGARTDLKPLGIAIFGHYSGHAALAKELGLPIPKNGQVVTCRLAHGSADDGVNIGGEYWKVADVDDPVVPAPDLPEQSDLVHQTSLLEE